MTGSSEAQDHFATHIAPTILSWRSARSPVIEQMMRVLERYDGTWVLPDLGPDAGPLTPTLLNDTIDDNGRRAASTFPRIFCPPLEAKESGVRSEEYAEIRRQMIGYTWFESELLVAMGRAYRQMIGMAEACFVVLPDFDLGCPRIVTRDPLHALPEPKAPEDLTPPRAASFIYGKSAKWIQDNYGVSITGDPLHDYLANTRVGVGTAGLWDLVEWIDDEYVYIGLLGNRDDLTYHTTFRAEALRPLCLRRYPNLTGRCTSVVGRAVTMGRIVSNLAHLVGHNDLLAKLTALDIMATQESILPDMYAVGTPGRVPILVGGEWQKGTSGRINLMKDTAQVGLVRGSPDPTSSLTQQRLERAFNSSAGRADPQTGRAHSAMRSGSAIDALLSASVDPYIGELHRTMESRLRQVNELVLDMFKAEWPGKQYHVFSGWPTELAMVEFTPAKHVETSANVVAYPIPGADAQNLTVAIGGLVGAEITSRDTGRQLHPWVQGAKTEERKIILEKLDDAMLMNLLSNSQGPQATHTALDLAIVKKAVAQGKSLDEAVMEAQEAAQKRQATIAPPPGPGEIAAPEAMPGLAAPGQGAEQPMEPPAQVPEPMPAVENVRRMAFALSGASGAPRR